MVIVAVAALVVVVARRSCSHFRSCISCCHTCGSSCCSRGRCRSCGSCCCSPCCSRCSDCWMLRFLAVAVVGVWSLLRSLLQVLLRSLLQLLAVAVVGCCIFGCCGHWLLRSFVAIIGVAIIGCGRWLWTLVVVVVAVVGCCGR